MTDKVKKDWQKIAEQDNEKPNTDEDNSIDVTHGDDTVEEEQVNNSLEFPNVADLEKKLTAAEQQAHENWEKCMRATAELDNVRRRAQRDVENAHKYGNEKFIDALLPVIDSLEQAMQTEDVELSEAGSQAVNGMKEGIALTLKLFGDVLDKFGVKQICPIGEKFDPQMHEAMSMVPMADKEPNTIIEVFQKGYLLNDRVVRPARVIVAKAP